MWISGMSPGLLPPGLVQGSEGPHDPVAHFLGICRLTRMLSGYLSDKQRPGLR